MGKFSGIAWTHHTYNNWIGCTRWSDGCKFCYAEEWDRVRFSQTKDAKGNLRSAHWGPGVARHRTSEHNRNDPLRWNREAIKKSFRYRVFCSSLSDVFDAEVPEEWRKEMFQIIKECSNLDWLVLTKRIENATQMLPPDWGSGYPNVWLGTTTENQKTADFRVPILSKVPAAIRFISVEPQLEEIDFSKWLVPKGDNPRPFDWMIFGGESGSEARKFDPDWIREPLLQAKKVDVKVFVKQMGSVWAAENGTEDKKGGDPKEWPPLFRCQEFPEALPANV